MCYRNSPIRISREETKMNMEKMKNKQFVMDVIEVERFLNNPPQGFTVEHRGGHRLVTCDQSNAFVFIDEFQSCKGKVIFYNSPGRKVTVRDLGAYTSLRNQLTSKKLYVLVSACAPTTTKRQEKKRKNEPVLGHYVVVINGSHPMIKWEMESGLNSTISSVAGESYKVNVDLSTALQGWVGDNFRLILDEEKVKPTWRDTHFTIKYRADALFDIPYTFGLSKRQFKISYCGR